MGEYIFDPPEATIKAYLETVQDKPVHTTAPAVLPEFFVQLTRVGGVDELVTDKPMVTFYCWGPSRAQAARFAETIRAHLRGCRRLGGRPVYRIRTVGGPTFQPDSETKRDRYQFTLEFKVRGTSFAP
ncbi:hypothetical protein MUN78_10200 [Leucobacter allii]|uniref:Tail terminator n=1 Tax=Leucobacter allii TaxID=2932247 RepID=A0ABY4FI58_9MICO|nr:hypothetical protein [Leucobacter allii]UOQ56075.1 hypothetical protein MUN78_10200 [Leucobacter allii]